MKNFALALVFLLTAPFASFLLQNASSAHADQNPVPVNVGLYNFSTYTVGVSTVAVILPKNIYRAGLIMQNNGSVSVVVKPGSVPANATDGIVLTAGQLIQINPPPVDALYGVSASSTAKIVMIENVK
jgi:hypothetical protein